MSKVVFQSEKKYYAVPYEHLFKCGTDIIALANRFRHNDDGYTDEKGCFHFPTTTLDKEHFFGTEAEWERLQALPDWKNAGRTYIFCSGKECNELVLEDPVVIEAMRVYAKTTDNLIVELEEDGSFPADPEGTPFISREPHKVLYSGAFEGDLDKTIHFNMGEERNKYITADVEEIRAIRGYIRSHANCGISDPTYKDPFAEE